MTFPYTPIGRGSGSRLLPLVPLKVVGTQRRVSLNALVDSGAEENVFRIDVAQELGIVWTPDESVTLVGLTVGCIEVIAPQWNWNWKGTAGRRRRFSRNRRTGAGYWVRAASSHYSR
jgi:hypothetical protein